MFKNYLKIAYRSLLKNKLFSAINVFGLALGMACALLTGLWVMDELSYDRFLADAENLYFVQFNYTPNSEVITNYTTPGPLQEAISKDIPEVFAATKTNFNTEKLIKVGGKNIKESGRYATTDFFKVFDLQVLSGDPNTALAQLDEIIITRKVAEKFFPNGEALNQTLQFDNDKFYTVGAVIENIPSNATVQFDWLINFKVQEQDWMRKSWGNSAFLTYIRLRPNTTSDQAEAAMSDIFARYTKWDNAETTYPILHPMTDMHLYSEYENGKIVGGRIEYVRIFSLVALFILLIACVNFMNLATARSALRAKEVGVRKVVGARRSSLIGLFMSESVLTSLLALLLALLLVVLVLPTFNTLFTKDLSLDLTNPTILLISLGLVLVTGFISGSYPALFLSSLAPIKILRGTLRFSAGPTLFRRTLVVFQFALSIFLIIGMLAVGRQMDYLRTKNLGMDRENILYIPMEGEIARSEKIETFRQEVMRQPAIASASPTMELPINITTTTRGLKWAGQDPDNQANVSAFSVGGDFMETMNIELLAGRDFRINSLVDSTNIIINEAAAKLMGMDNPVGQEIEFWEGKGQIVGLFKDFHINSLHETINPLVITYIPENTQYLLVKTRPGQTTRAIAEVEKLTKEFNPNYPFTYHFMDEAYEKMYRSEQQVNTLVNYFGILAILISCLGLFGLAAFTAEQRTKEIGVRKVLGATATSIVTLLSKDFLKLVLVALVLAVPLGWWALDKWLGTFAYHTELSWTLFGLAGGLAVGIALLTVSFQSLRAALMNPVESLRSE